ncbi:hypothetical protein [Caenibius tardaugens]|uniref:hypothetical protein n=1 Tax=Caenibius tardaugens TaxID=169176 RepID=UPI000F5F9A70|nr:hypothetical protein [Caenibius tardaugens]AZI37886.1 hypothetical protein EGO55_19545 [Caenibius tardaugens NBRC 16725]
MGNNRRDKGKGWNEMSAQEDKGGRPRRTGEPMNERDAHRALECLRGYLERFPMSYEKISGDISTWHSVNADKPEKFAPFSIEDVNFRISRSSVARAIAENILPEPSAMKILFLWIQSIDLCNIEYKTREYEENLLSKEILVLSARKVFGYFTEMRAVKISPWVGDYTLYRPFHLDPRNQVQVNHLKIGSENSDFDCSLTSSFPGMFGKPQENVGMGKLTPLDDTHAVAMMALNLEHVAGLPGFKPPAGQYTLHFSDPVKSDRVDGFRGIMVASEGPNPSAWPIYAVRVPDGQAIEPHVLSRDEYKGLPIIVRKQLDRGGIYWDEPDFPKTLSRAYSKPPQP